MESDRSVVKLRSSLELTVSVGFFLVGCALYYIFPQDLSHSLGMFYSLLGFDAASLDAAVLIE